jgi:hypothetical protein
VERPAIEARLLFWLTALHAVNGMLYYDVAIWSSQCPKERKCKPATRINSTAFTDFVPATFPNPSPGSTNGDGSFTYPGEAGALLNTHAAPLCMHVACCMLHVVCCMLYVVRMCHAGGSDSSIHQSAHHSSGDSVTVLEGSQYPPSAWPTLRTG